MERGHSCPRLGKRRADKNVRAPFYEKILNRKMAGFDNGELRNRARIA